LSTLWPTSIDNKIWDGVTSSVLDLVLPQESSTVPLTSSVLPEAENKMSKLVPPLLVVLLLVSLVLEPTGLLRSGEENKMNNLVLFLVSVSELSQEFLTEPQVLSTPPEVDKISLSHLKNRILALDSPADSTLHSVVPKVDSVGVRINNKS